MDLFFNFPFVNEFHPNFTRPVNNVIAFDWIIGVIEWTFEQNFHLLSISWSIPSNHCHQSSPELVPYWFLQGEPFLNDNLIISMEMSLSVWKHYGFLCPFHNVQFRYSLTVLTAVILFVMVLCNTTFQRDALCLVAAEAGSKWLLSSAAKEMHTCTLASYVITWQGCTAHCSLLLAHRVSLGWKFICSWVFVWVSKLPPLFQKFHKCSVKVWLEHQMWGKLEISTEFLISENKWAIQVVISETPLEIHPDQSSSHKMQ